MPEVLNTCLQYFITKLSLQLVFALKNLGNREVGTAGIVRINTVSGQVVRDPQAVKLHRMTWAIVCSANQVPAGLLTNYSLQINVSYNLPLSHIKILLLQKSTMQ